MTGSKKSFLVVAALVLSLATVASGDVVFTADTIFSDTENPNYVTVGKFKITDGATITVTDGGKLTTGTENIFSGGGEGTCTFIIEGTGQVIGGGGTTYIGRSNGDGVFQMTGGLYDHTTGSFIMLRGSANATFDISGGVFDYTGGAGTDYFSLGFSGNTGTSTFKVTGSAATIDIGAPLRTTDGTNVFEFIIDDSENHISTIKAASIDFSGGTNTVKMGTLGFAPAEDDVFNLITITGSSTFDLETLNLALDTADAESWELRVSGDGKTLQAVAVPEPATMGLLGMGLVGLLARRRRR